MRNDRDVSVNSSGDDKSVDGWDAVEEEEEETEEHREVTLTETERVSSSEQSVRGDSG